LVDKQKTFRVQLVILHHVLTRNAGGRNLEQAIKDLVSGNLSEKDTQGIKWDIYIHSDITKIFKDILLHSRMMDQLYFGPVYRAAVRRTVSREEDVKSNNTFLISIDQTKLKNLPYVTGELLNNVCQLLAERVQDIVLGRKEVDVEGKTGSTIEKIKDTIHEKVTNMNIKTASEYKAMEEKEVPPNQQRLKSSQVKVVTKSFPRKQLRDLADYMYRTSTILEGNNQLSFYLYTIRHEEIEKINGMLKGMQLGLYSIANPYYNGDKPSTGRKEKRWKDFVPAIKRFYETEFTNISLSLLAENILKDFYHDRHIPANNWKIGLKWLETKEGVYGTNFIPDDEDYDNSWNNVNLIFDGFRLAHDFVGVLRANNHLVKLNPYVFLYDNVALKFETYDDLIRNSNDYVKLRSKFHGSLEKKEFMLPRQALAKLPEKLSSSFPKYLKDVLSWDADAYTDTWELTGQEYTFSISKIVIRVGEGLHPSVVLFTRNEESLQDFRYHDDKVFPITQPPYNFDLDVSTLWIDSSQLSYFEERSLDWAGEIDETWDKEFVSAVTEIVPNRNDYFAILLMITRIYNQAIHHLNPEKNGRKTTVSKALDLRKSSISDLLWDLEQEDCAFDVFSKLKDIISDISYSEEKVRKLLEIRGGELCGTLRVWLGKCAQSLVYIRNMVYDAKLFSRGIVEREIRPPIIDKKTIQDLRLATSTGNDMRQFSASFPPEVWEWDEDTTFGYLVRKDNGEYKTFLDRKTGIKYFLHRWGIWIGEGGKVRPWQSGAQVADLPQDNRAELLTGSEVKYIEEGG